MTNTNQFFLKSEFTPAGDQSAAIEKLVDGLESGLAHQILLGVTGSGKTFTIANVIQQVQRPAIIMAPNKTLAAQLYGEMKEFFPNNAVEYFVSYYDYYQPEAYIPASDVFIEKDSSINEHIEQMRLSATKALLESRDVIIIASVSSIYGLGDPQACLSMVLHLACGHDASQRDLLRRLADLQYVRNDVELHRGGVRVRGDVIDIFPAESDQDAVRVELFDDKIESLTWFDPLTGETDYSVPRLTIYPKNHYVMPKERIVSAIEKIKVELTERLEQLRSLNKLAEAQRLEQRTKYDIEMLCEIGHCKGIENYSRLLTDRESGQPPPTLFDYLPDDAILIIDESHVTVPQIGGMYKGDRSRKESLVEYGFRLPSTLDNRPLKFDEFSRRAPQTIYVSATPGKYELKMSPEAVEQVVRPTGLLDPEVEVRPAENQVDDVLSEVHLRVAAKERVLITTLTKRMAEDLTEYYMEQGVRVRYLHSDIDTVERVDIIRNLRLGEFDVLIGINLLREGLDMPEVSLVAILDADKEGFLRSEGSLIQTIGRAARNMNGKAILYADKVTGSMQRAMSETDCRRKKQREYNKKHGVTPKTIMKNIRNIMQVTPGKKTDSSKKTGKGLRAAEGKPDYLKMSDKARSAYLKRLEKKMYRHARDMEFEKAAAVRDEINQINHDIIMKAQ